MTTPQPFSGSPELQALLDETAHHSGVPGVAVGILHDGKETLLSTGVTIVDSGYAVDEHTLFMIGSTTKTFTGALLVALAEDGALDLDEPIASYLPELPLADPVARETVTPRHLLTHTGGFLGDRGIETGWGDEALATAVSRFGELPQVFPPGEVFSYSNTGFMVAGRLAEVIGGDTYENLVRARILEPLEMRDSLFLPWEVLLRKHSTGHALGADGPGVPSTLGLSRSTNPAGGLWSSARDQLRWARFFLSGETTGTKPISDAGRELMWRPHRRAALGFDEVGLSWLRTRHGDRTVVRHGGNVSFLQVSEFITVPSENFAVTVLTNSGGGGAVARAVVQWALENIAGVTPPTSLPAVPADDLTDYPGRYETGDLAFDITESGPHLQVRMSFVDNEDAPAPPPFTVAFVDDDVFARTEDTRHRGGRFVRDHTGRVRMLEFGGRTVPRVAPA
jgi:CubicO group peptidase (beta-lactamase class C family)